MRTACFGLRCPFFAAMLFVAFTAIAQPEEGLVARFSFNDIPNQEDVSQRKIKLVGTGRARDRFGNEDHAIYLFGNKYSYISLGSDPQLKNKISTISLWVKVENICYTGWGRFVNPFIVTKRSRDVDFYEAYSMGYYPETENAIALCTKDSTREISISGIQEFSLRNWHHVAITYDYHYFSFYIDGKLENTMRKDFDVTFDPLDSVLIGATGSNKNSRFLNAIVDDIRFYDRVLDAKEIRTLYKEPNPNQTRILLNWIFVIIGILLCILLITLYIRYRIRKTLEKEKQQLKIQNVVLETELRVNRALMNPHFVFNSLNALQNLILKKEYNGANDYLVKFSRLIRLILENNMSDEISLEHEIDMLQRYLELENLRFKGNIRYGVHITDDISPAFINLPVMMIQPFVENAIWHGLLNKAGEKILDIRFSKRGTSYLYCEIEDNGTGRKMNQTPSFKKSLATVFIEQRLNLLNQLHRLECQLTIEDKANGGGTVVKILLPILKTVEHA